MVLLAQVVSAADFRGGLEAIGDNTNLTNYDTNIHADATGQGGARNITSAIHFIIDMAKWVLGSLAVLMLVINAIKLIATGTDADDRVTKEKNFLKYALMGLVLVFVAEEAVTLAFFGQEGEVLRNEASAAEFATAGSQIFHGIYTFLEIMIGSIAVFMVVYSGFQMLVGSANEEAVNNGRKRIFTALLGLAVVGLSELVIKDIVFKDQGETIDVERGRILLASITNFLASIIGTMAVAAFIYAGFLYILNFGNDELTGKAKKMMMSAVLGMLLAAGAFALVSTVIEVPLAT